MSIECDAENFFHFCHLIVEIYWLFKSRVFFQAGRTFIRVTEPLGDRDFLGFNILYFLLHKPLDSFADLPQTILLRLLLCIHVSSNSVLFATVPPAIILTPISPIVNSESLLFIIKVLAVVANTIRVNINAVALHIVIGPGAVVFTTVGPQVNTVAVNFII